MRWGLRRLRGRFRRERDTRDPAQDSEANKNTEEQEPAQKHQEPDKEAVDRYNLTVLAEGVNPTVDIVAIHGLGGGSHKSWTSRDGTLWLRDLLPGKIPNARIFTWGYDADPTSSTATSNQTIRDYGRDLVTKLGTERSVTDSARRPIIFIAHSLGGLILKQALIYSQSGTKNHLEHSRAIKISTYGIMFFGTPHLGGNGAGLAKIVVDMASVVIRTNSKIISDLQHDSDALAGINQDYLPISSDFVTRFVYETKKTDIVAGKQVLIVQESSAVVPGAQNAEVIAVNSNHRDMIKFTQNHPDYKTISDQIGLMTREAAGAVETRWEAENPMKSVGLTEVDPLWTLPMCLKWLQCPEANEPSSEVIGELDGTLGWVLPHECLQSWICEGGLLWLRGKIGSGKSVILRYIQRCAKDGTDQNLRSALSESMPIIFDASQQETGQVYRNFLRQSIIAILKSTPEAFAKVFQLTREKDESIHSLAQTLSALCSYGLTIKRPVVFMIDSAEDFRDGLQTLLNFFHTLRGIAAKQDGKIHVLFAARPTYTTWPLLKTLPTIVVEKHNSSDLSYFLRHKLAALIEESTPTIVEELDRHLVLMARGCFQWLSIELDELVMNWTGRGTGASRFTWCPDPLHDAYRRAASHIPRDLPGWKRERLKTHGDDIIRLVAAAVRPVTLSELRFALALAGGVQKPKSLFEATYSREVIKDDQEMIEQIMTLTGGLVEVIKPDYVCLTHDSVTSLLSYNLAKFNSKGEIIGEREYLSSWEREGDRLWSKACISFLAYPELNHVAVAFGGKRLYWKEPYDVPITDMRALVLLPYAVEHWVRHYKNAGHAVFGVPAELRSWLDEDYSPHIDAIQDQSRVFVNWFRLHCHICRPGSKGYIPTFRSFAAYHGINGVSREVPKLSLAEGYPVERADEVINAIIGDNLELFRHNSIYVSEKEDRLYIQRYNSCLSAAITFNREDIVNILLREKGKYVDDFVSERPPSAPWIGPGTSEDPWLDIAAPCVSHIYWRRESDCSSNEPTAEEADQQAKQICKVQQVKRRWAQAEVDFLRQAFKSGPSINAVDEYIETKALHEYMDEEGIGLGIKLQPVSCGDDIIEQAPDVSAGNGAEANPDTASIRSEDTIRDVQPDIAELTAGFTTYDRCENCGNWADEDFC